jgi:protease I
VHASGRMVATICHGPWILISAGIVRGRRLTSTVGIRDDLVNAGATWIDEPVVIDGNIISSRVPKDLPAFGRAMVQWLERT